MRNSPIESSLNKKMLARWMGPYIVIARKDGGAYIVAEMDGSLLKDKVAAFRLIPYFARRHIKLPENIEDVIDQTKENLKMLVDMPDNDEPAIPIDFIFDEKGVESGSEEIDEEDEEISEWNEE